MSGVGDGRTEHQRRHGQQTDQGTGNGSQGTGEGGQQGDRATSVAELRKRARRGDAAARAELTSRGIVLATGTVATGRTEHARRHPRPADEDDERSGS